MANVLANSLFIYTSSRHSNISINMPAVSRNKVDESSESESKQCAERPKNAIDGYGYR